MSANNYRETMRSRFQTWNQIALTFSSQTAKDSDRIEFSAGAIEYQ
ncbi:MAG: hypothetical protein AB4050_10075 [Synechococcus sp.]